VSCTPAAGSALDLHQTQPWTKAGREPVTWWKDAQSSRATQCFNYTPATGKTVASIVDHFGLDMVTFIQDEHNNRIFGLGNVTIKFPNLRAEEMAFALGIVTTATSRVTRGSELYKPYFRCVYYDELGNMGQVTCMSTDASGNADCVRPGVAWCSLVYWDTNVTETIPFGVHVKVCNARWAQPGEFQKVAYLVDANGKNITEAEALTNILMLMTNDMEYEEARNLSKCKETKTATKELYVRKDPVVTINWLAHCPGGGPVTTLMLSNYHNPDFSGRVQVDLNEQLTAQLLSLRSLRTLSMWVNSGQLPPELGSLSHLREFAVQHTCLTGGCADKLVFSRPQMHDSIKALQQQYVLDQ
jgi:hypothetical protein